MRNELEDKLFNEFPEFFKHRENLKASLMGFGFACGDGWFDLIYKLMKDIKAVYDTEREYFHVVQVKEKFAGLRFYITAASSEVFDLIHTAEDESYKICESCGKSGIMRIRTNWYRTLCEECAGDEWVKVPKRKQVTEVM